MLKIIKTRIQQKYRTMAWPDGPPPELPGRFVGRPVVSHTSCERGCDLCISVCPVNAIHRSHETGGPVIDTGRCIFCRACDAHRVASRVCLLDSRTVRFDRVDDHTVGTNVGSLGTVADCRVRDHHPGRGDVSFAPR